MKQVEQIQMVITAGIMAVVLVVVGMMARVEFNSYWKRQAELVEKELYLQAAADCGMAGRTSWKDANGAETVVPNWEVYEMCMGKKGY